MSELTPVVKAAILRQVAAERHPKLALPNLAHHHDITLGDLQALLQKHGWPRPDAMRRAADLLEGTADDEPDRARPLASFHTEPAAPEPAPAQRETPAEDDQLDTQDLLTAAANSHKARTRNLGQKITGLLDDLRQALDTEAGEAQARAEVLRLREQLREAEAKLRVGRPAPKAPATSTGGDFACGVHGCDKTFSSKQGITMHNTRVHREQAAS